MPADAPQFSVEFFPPRTAAGRDKLDRVHAELAALGMDYFSVTYGAGGATRDGTKKLALDFHAAGSEVAPHLSSSREELDSAANLLNTYREAGIQRLVVLRGDAGGRGFYARDMVEFVRQRTGDHFKINVACYPDIHPETPNFALEIEYFRQKIEAGADAAITQYFYDADSYFRFVDACRKAGVDVSVVPGVMPITDYEKLRVFSKRCGARIPDWLAGRLARFGDDLNGLREYGAEVVSRLCDKLLTGGAPGLHFYCLNRAGPVRGIWESLDLSKRR